MELLLHQVIEWRLACELGWNNEVSKLNQLDRYLFTLLTNGGCYECITHREILL